MKKFEVLNGAAGLLLLATVGYLMVHSQQQDATRVDDQATVQAADKKASDASAKATQAQTDAAKAIQAVKEANLRLKAAGKPQVPVPTLAPAPPPGAQPSGLSDEQIAVVRSIVLAELLSQKLVLTDTERSQIVQTVVALVPKPKDGISPTDEQVQIRITAAVAAFCADGKCSVPGPEGKPASAVTDEQLLAAAQQALSTYCAQESSPCKGEDGKPGGEGSPGKDAPPPYSVTDMDCVGDDAASVWVVYLGNGTDQKQFERPGPCRIGPDPD